MEKQKLSKKEQYLLRKEQKKQRRLLLERRRKIKKMLSIFLPILLLLGITIIFAKGYISKENHSGKPKIEILEKEYDAGTVSINGGLVKHTYEIKNIGDGDLEIDRIWTSCMCTTAILKIGDKESPKFGMHDNPLFWSEKIPPGQSGYLEVIFDPAFHGPQGIGPVVRAVYLSTNDPQNKKAEVILIADVVE